MMRHTGGSAVAATSTKSKPFSRAARIASRISMTPSCSPSSPITRTWATRILSLMRAIGRRRLSGREPRPRKPVAIPHLLRLEVPSLEFLVPSLINSKLETRNPKLRVSQRTLLDELARHLYKIIDRHYTDVAFGPLADR